MMWICEHCGKPLIWVYDSGKKYLICPDDVFTLNSTTQEEEISGYEYSKQ